MAPSGAMVKVSLIRSFFVASLVIAVGLAGSGLAAQRPQVPVLPEDGGALDAATSAVCNKQVVLLGEAAHGNGHSDAFKAAMVARLIERCGFRAVLFEASFPQFVPIWRAQRAGRSVTPDQVGTAVGGLWKFDREFAPLLPYLAAQASEGLFLGGIDFQLGGLDQDFANAGMIAELSEGLGPLRAGACRRVVEARIYRDLDPEQRRQAHQCTAAIARRLAGTRGAIAAEQRMMLQSLTAFLDTVTIKGPGPYIAARDLAMFKNLQSLHSRLPRGTRLIIWTANAHAAKDAQGADGFSGVRNLGSYVVAAYGQRSYALGTTALTGTQRWGREIRPLPDMPASSLEQIVIRPGEDASVFLDAAALQQAGPKWSRLFGLKRAHADWSEHFDGVVVFAEEHAAFSARYGN